MRSQISNSRSQIRCAGFTIIEIALCLAIIGFALVAIIGVLPIGLNVQKDNREETIINQDAAVWMDAIRNGAHGYDDLTNYVVAITNYVWAYKVDNNNVVTADGSSQRTAQGGGSPETDVYTRSQFIRNGSVVASSPLLWLTNGLHIIGVLSRPRIEWDTGNHFFSNYIVANVRAISGSAVEKYPQNNSIIQDSAFSYRLIVENLPYVAFDTNQIHATLYQTGSSMFDPALPDIGGLTNTEPSFPSLALSDAQIQRSNYWCQIRNNRRIYGVAYTNSHDIRLTFRWPLLPTGDAGNGRLSFRLFTGGLLTAGAPEPGVLNIMYFLKPSTYVQAR